MSDEKVPQEWIAELEPYCSKIAIHYLDKKKIALRFATGIFSKKPFQCLYHYDTAAAKKIKTFAESISPDKIFFQLIRTAGYAAAFPAEKCIIDLMDCFSYNYMLRSKRSSFLLKYFYRKEYVRTRNYEAALLNSYEQITIISMRDELLLPNRSKDVLVVPNGVIIPVEKKETKSIDILFTGNLAYFPNIEAAKFVCNDIVPQLLKSKPDLKVVIAGANPHQSILALKSKTIQVLENIDDMIAVKQRASLFIAPMFLSTGIQNKILEAMACGIPVLTTPQAAEAIAAMPGRHIFTALSASEFAEQAIQISKMTAEEIGIICTNAKALVTENFNWESNTLLLEKFFS